MKTNCSPIQASVRWCQGKPNYSGMRGEVLYLAASDIVSWPKRKKIEGTEIELAEYVDGGTDSSSFILAADKKWRLIDILPAKSKASSDPNGENPSSSQLNKLELVHPGTGAEASNLAAYINNVPCVFLYKDMAGYWRVVGCERWANEIKNTVAHDGGQGAAGTAQTTISVESPDTTNAPVYHGSVNIAEDD